MGTTCSLFGDGDLAAGERWVRRIATRITRFDESSELSRLNTAAAWVDISAELEQLLRASLRAFETSGGLVNIAVLPSMLAIGYTRSLAHGPTAPHLDQAHSVPSLPDVLKVACGRQLAARLGDHVLVNLGGDLYARGEWPVAIAGKTYLLRNLGAATSSSRKRRWGDLHHLIDPRTGLPAATRLEEVSVVAETALDAEVLAKTVLLSGRAA